MIEQNCQNFRNWNQ